MKLLCERKFNSEEIVVILDQIPLTYKTYYLTLGPERCRANGYSVTEIRKEYDNIKKSGDLDEPILSSFIVGNSYSLSEIKEKLREIYTGLGITKAPKATDLEEYFELKKGKVLTSSGKRADSFKLIGLKNNNNE